MTFSDLSRKITSCSLVQNKYESIYGINKLICNLSSYPSLITFAMFEPGTGMSLTQHTYMFDTCTKGFNNPYLFVTPKTL